MHARSRCLDRASDGSFYTSFYKTVPSWPAHRRLRLGNCRGRPRFSFQSALSRPFHTPALASRSLPCCLRSSAACLLLLPFPTPLRLVPFWAQCPHVLPSTRYFLPCEMFHACFYTSSTQSPDALFSIVSKPPNPVFINTDSGFSYRQSVVHNTDWGFPNHRPVFQSGFHYLCTDFRTIGRGFSWGFSTPGCFLSPHTDGVFYAYLIFFSPYRS